MARHLGRFSQLFGHRGLNAPISFTSDQLPNQRFRGTAADKTVTLVCDWPAILDGFRNYILRPN
jgi:hypothetical protein